MPDVERVIIMNHLAIKQLPYGKPIRNWLIDRYGKTEAIKIWKKTRKNYQNYLSDLPDYGGRKNGHVRAIYGGLLIFALYPALPDQPTISELQDFVQKLFMGPMQQDIALPSARMRNSQKAMGFYMCFRFCATVISSGSARSTDS